MTPKDARYAIGVRYFWHGKEEDPMPPDTRVLMKLRSGEEVSDISLGYQWDWDAEDPDQDIIAFEVQEYFA